MKKIINGEQFGRIIGNITTLPLILVTFIICLVYSFTTAAVFFLITQIMILVFCFLGVFIISVKNALDEEKSKKNREIKIDPSIHLSSKEIENFFGLISEIIISELKNAKEKEDFEKSFGDKRDNF